MEEKFAGLKNFLKELNKQGICLAFSGGIDSTVLLFLCKDLNLTAVTFKSVFQTEEEIEETTTLCNFYGVKQEIIEYFPLENEIIKNNPKDRCYHCKRLIMDTIAKAAAEDGYAIIADGTNASDDASDRPGTRALKELGIRSPLRECSLTKDEIRRLSREAGLFTWDKSAYACLATRIPSGEPIDKEKLSITEEAEDFLQSLGFSDFRVRLLAGCARIQIRESQYPLLLEKRTEINNKLGELYKAVLLDMEARDE